jgi:DnaK suppressor protein
VIEPRELQAQRERLERRLAEIEALLRESADAVKPVKLDQTSVGRLSRMDALQQQAMRIGSREAFARERRRVHAALERIREGRYGTCCACQDALSIGRLQADPAAPFCMDCEIEIKGSKRSRRA